MLPTRRPLISVITICYNAEAFIQDCMSSVVQQSFADFEYIVIDGGSTDRTMSMVESFRDGLAYVHSKPDKGIADAFNQGVQHAQGDWLIFLNADDYFHTHAVLEEMALFLRAEPQRDVIYGQIQLVTRDANPKPVSAYIGAEFSFSTLIKKQNIPHPAAFTSRHYFNKVGRFDEGFRIAMDYEFYLRGGAALNAYFVPVLVAKMREGGVSKQSVRASLHEGYLAQVKHAVLPKPVAYWIYQQHWLRFIIKSWCMIMRLSYLKRSKK